MQDLRLVAANENGTHLVLRSPAGDKYLLSIDERLRAAVRGDRARLGQLEIEHDGQLRPRDIQARIRAGATAEQVAASAGVPVERVRRFEGPVLAEREHMAQMAQRGAVRRPGQEGRPATLADALATRLDPLRIKPEDLGWDSWRRDDGRWLVQLVFDLKEDDTCRARFLYDPRARTVCAENDEGRWLAGELDQRPARVPFVPRLAQKPAEDATDEPAHSSVPASIRGDHPAGRRLPDAPARRNAPESARPAPAVVAKRPPADVVAKPSRPDVVAKRPAPDVVARQSPAAATPSVAPPAAAPAKAPAPAVPVAPEAPAAKSASVPAVDTRPRRVPALDYLVPPVPDGPAEAPNPPRREPANRGPARRPGIRADVLSARPQRRSVMDLPPMTAAAAREEEPAEERRTGTHDGRSLLAGAASGGRSRRASVPSWDDILFGTRRRD